MRILVAEDNELTRQSIEFLLKKFPKYEVRTVINGRDAWEQFVKSPADLLITDNRMPEMNGPELITRVKELIPTTRTILISGDGDLAKLARACGADAYLAKPFGVPEFLALVKTMEK